MGRIATGTATAFLGAVLGNGLAYLYGIVIGRSLGAEGAGFYFLALGFMQFISALCRVGLSEGLLRFVAIYSSRADWARVKGTILSALSVATSTNVVAACLLFASAGLLSAQLFRQPALSLYVKWFACILPFFSLSLLIANAIQALKRIDLVVLSRDILQPLVMFAMALVLLRIARGPTAFLAAHFVSVVVALVASAALLQRASPALEKAPSAVFEWRRLLAFSLPIAGSDLSHYLLRWSDTFLLSLLGSAAQIGIYSAALRTTLLLNLLAVSVNALYAPIIAEHHHQGRHRELEAIVKTLLRWCLTLALPIVLSLTLLADDILSLWGPEFVAGSTALAVLAASQLLFILSNMLAFTLLMSGHQYLELGNTILTIILTVTMDVALIPGYGITGAAVAMLVSQTAAFLIRLAEARWILGIHLYTLKYVKPLAALIPAASMALLLQKSLKRIVSAIPLGSSVGAMVMIFLLVIIGYLVTLYVLGLEQEDTLVWKQFRQLRI